MIKEGMERNHSKVQVSALELFSEAFLACPAVFEDALVDLLPPLLVLANARNQQAQTKAVALRNELGRRLPACSLVPAIVQSIRAVRPPPRITIMFSCRTGCLSLPLHGSRVADVQP